MRNHANTEAATYDVYERNANGSRGAFVETVQAHDYSGAVRSVYAAHGHEHGYDAVLVAAK